MVRIPSCTCPMLSNTPIAVHMTKPDMVTTRSASPIASAMSPRVMAPRVQSQTAIVPTLTRRTLLLVDTVKLRNVINRVWRWNAAVWSDSASFACSSSRSRCAKSLTV